MNAMDWIVFVSGVAAIAWVNWYFFLAKQPAARATAGASGAQEVTITVQGGYSPAEIHLKKGVPARLVFDRQETSGCSEEVVIPDFGIRKFLPAFKKTVIELTPDEAGTHEFTCGMSMLHGRLVVES
jgi:plastocyanin domain-containing protein